MMQRGGTLAVTWKVVVAVWALAELLMNPVPSKTTAARASKRQAASFFVIP